MIVGGRSPTGLCVQVPPDGLSAVWAESLWDESSREKLENNFSRFYCLFGGENSSNFCVLP